LKRRSKKSCSLLVANGHLRPNVEGASAARRPPTTGTGAPSNPPNQGSGGKKQLCDINDFAAAGEFAAARGSFPDAQNTGRLDGLLLALPLTISYDFRILQLPGGAMAATAIKSHEITPEERLSAKDFSDAIASARSSGTVKIVVEQLSGALVAVPISESFVEAIRELSALIRGGKQVGMFADDPEVSPEQASDLLGISRPSVVQRIKRGDINARMVGAHHRIRMSDLLTFQQREAERRSSPAEIEARAASARFAIANTAMEGGTILPETEALCDQWIRGEIDDDELMEQTLQRFGPGA
jgi:excisionase family DNA binding protein